MLCDFMTQTKQPSQSASPSLGGLIKLLTANHAFRTAAVVLSIVLIMAIGFGVSYRLTYAAEFYPGVALAGLNLGGKTRAQAEALLQTKIDELYRSGLPFSYRGRQVAINPRAVSTAGPDLSYDLVSFNLAGTLDRAYAVGRETNWLAALTDHLTALAAGKEINFDFTVDGPKFTAALRENFADLENPSQSAKLILTEKDGAYTTAVTPETFGQGFDYPAALNQLTANLASLNNRLIELKLATAEPQVKAATTGAALQLVVPTLAKAPLTLNFDRQKWTIDKSQLASWLDFQPPLSGQTEAGLGLNPEKFYAYLDQNIAPAINQEPQDAKFKMENNRVTEFQGAEPGRSLDRTATLTKINQDFINGAEKEIELVVAVTEPQVATAKVNDLGIKEIAGVGISNFAGSPVNRRHNIKNGGRILNGVMIAAGEEFSLIKALGAVDASTGYLTELVIKGNRTVPEYGGGLCQIGTTIFRAALDAGLPILERAPHSYRVVYYEPAGLDATIYIPKPDVRFVNDTGYPLLIQTKIEGDILKFEFWGQKDGRTMKYTGQTESSDLYDIKPKIWNFVSPGPTKIVETLDLPVGKKKCTESSHVGATTEFAYQVTYPSGEIKNQIFHSVYRPWQAVCLVGVEKLSEPTVEVVPADATAAPSGVVTAN